jgi:hypothetical protein
MVRLLAANQVASQEKAATKHLRLFLGDAPSTVSSTCLFLDFG